MEVTHPNQNAIQKKDINHTTTRTNNLLLLHLAATKSQGQSEMTVVTKDWGELTWLKYQLNIQTCDRGVRVIPHGCIHVDLRLVHGICRSRDPSLYIGKKKFLFPASKIAPKRSFESTSKRYKKGKIYTQPTNFTPTHRPQPNSTRVSRTLIAQYHQWHQEPS